MDNLKNNDINITSLFVSYFMGEITPAELQILENWLNAGSQNREQFAQFEATWLLSGKTAHLNKIDNQTLWSQLDTKIRQTSLKGEENQYRKSSAMRILKIAASWIVFMAIGSLLTIWLSSDNTVSAEQITEITAPLGAKSFVKLPDGTSIWLNAGSKVSYDRNFNINERKISLSGEAFFNVATNKEKPFTVHTSDIIVRAFGTRFNVKAYPEEKTITATLEEGKIDVTLIHASSDKLAPVILAPNQKIVYFKSNNSFGQSDPASKEIAKEAEKTTRINPLPSKMLLASNVNTELYTSWKDNRWVIEGVTFDSLVPMLERRFNMKIQFKDEELKDYKFTGTIQNETIEQIMEALKFTAPLDFKIIRDSIILSVNPGLKSRYRTIITSKTMN